MREGASDPPAACGDRDGEGVRRRGGFGYIRIETVEKLVTEHYRSVELTSAERQLVEERLSENFAEFRAEIEVERAALERQRGRLLRERERLLQAYYADAIQLDLLKSEQERIADQLDYIKDRLGAAEKQEAVIDFNLGRALQLATNVYEIYKRSDQVQKRLLNQAFFKKLFIDSEGVRSELAEPYDILLSPYLRTGDRSTATGQPNRGGPDWSAWEASFNENEPRPPLDGGRGSKDVLLVGAGGFEPPKAEPTGLQPVPFGRSGTPPGVGNCSRAERGGAPRGYLQNRLSGNWRSQR